jgi:hypothetical protein
MLSTLTALLSVFMGSYSVHAQDSMLDGPSAKRYLECATGCQKSFYFSEQSDKTFAQLRTACIEGCSLVVDANMTAYQGCNSECKDLYPYRHGNNAEFAGFQKACIVGCRRVH